MARMAPALVINPPDDTDFVSACEAAMDPPPASTGALQTALRRAYPAAVVHPRALSGEMREVWYVYRDGHWVSS